MKNVGVIRRVDCIGRITPPMEFRRALEIFEGDEVEILLQGTSIVIKKHRDTCIFCDSSENIKYFKGKYVCINCISKLTNSSTK